MELLGALKFSLILVALFSASTEAFSCSNKDVSPVCGSNGFQFAHRCWLTFYNYENFGAIRKALPGVCDGPSFTKCPCPENFVADPPGHVNEKCCAWDDQAKLHLTFKNADVLKCHMNCNNRLYFRSCGACGDPESSTRCLDVFQNDEDFGPVADAEDRILGDTVEPTGDQPIDNAPNGESEGTDFAVESGDDVIDVQGGNHHHPTPPRTTSSTSTTSTSTTPSTVCLKTSTTPTTTTSTTTPTTTTSTTTPTTTTSTTTPTTTTSTTTPTTTTSTTTPTTTTSTTTPTTTTSTTTPTTTTSTTTPTTTSTTTPTTTTSTTTPTTTTSTTTPTTTTSTTTPTTTTSTTTPTTTTSTTTPTTTTSTTTPTTTTSTTTPTTTITTSTTKSYEYGYGYYPPPPPVVYY